MDDSLQIVVETKTKICIDKCIICQKTKDNNRNKELTSTANGRTTIIECSTFLQDNLLEGVEELDQIKYHVNTCYSRYVRQKKRTDDKDGRICRENLQIQQKINLLPQETSKVHLKTEVVKG